MLPMVSSGIRANPPVRRRSSAYSPAYSPAPITVRQPSVTLSRIVRAAGPPMDHATRPTCIASATSSVARRIIALLLSPS